MRTVRFRRLVLAGFGPYRDPVEVRLSDGVNTHVAPNERGKSSLVAGLVATIFGLPTSNDPSAFGSARFRNWDRPRSFRGELELEADGTVFKLTRDFDTHEIRLEYRAEAGWSRVAAGQENPQARKPNAAFRDWLEKTLGMTGRELFEATFCVAQPIPSLEKDRIDRAVQELISGPGAGFARALQALERDLSGLTRATRDRGVTSANQRNDRELERVAARAADLRARIEAARATVDSLEAARRRVSEAEAELDRVRAELDSAEATVRAWSDWRRLASEYRQALASATGLERALVRARELCAEIERESEGFARQYPEFDGRPNLRDLERDLDGLVSLAEKLDEVGASRARLEQELAEVSARRSELDSTLGSARAWREFGPAPLSSVRSARRAAAQVLRGWERFEANLATVARCDLRLASFRPDEPEVIERRLGLARSLRSIRDGRDRASRALAGLRRARRITMASAGLLLALFVLSISLSLASFVFLPLTRPSVRVPALVTATLAALGAVACTAAAFAFGARHARAGLEEERLEREESELAREAAEIDAELGLPPAADEATLGAMRERALDRRRALAEERARAMQEVEEFAARAFRCDPDGVQEADVRSTCADEAWLEVARLLEVAAPHEDVRTPARLASFLARADATWWDGIEREAERCEGILSELQGLAAAEQAKRAELDTLAERRVDLERALESASVSLGAVLAASGRDPGLARDRWREACDRLEALRARSARLQAIFAEHGVTSADELAVKAAAARDAAVVALGRWKDLVDAHPGLPEAGGSGDPEGLEVRWRALQARVGELRAQLATADAARRDATRELAVVEGREPLNIAGAEVELELVEQERREIELLADALTLAWTELRDAAAEFHATYRARLQASCTARFADITGVPGRTVEIDDEFRVSIRQGGVPCDIAQLSRGARDQLYLAIRLAVGDLLAGGIELPLIFDDPFVTCDSARLANLGRIIREVGRTRQILVFSHMDAVSSWGEPMRLWPSSES